MGVSTPWAVVLAAGEGTRLRSLTTDSSGVSTPKQFWSLDGGPSLLQLAVLRAERQAHETRITSILARDHERWWRDDLSGLPSANLFVQPENKGTAAGVLLPVLGILERDPEARLVVLPSDHFIGVEGVLARSVSHALRHLDDEPGQLTLLGIEPEEPDPQLGWIVPSGGAGAEQPRPVERFVEKPEERIAREVMRLGGVWNSFIFVAAARTIVEMFESRLPDTLDLLRRGNADAEELDRIYSELAPADFSRDLLQGSEDRLRVLAVPRCGWSDLGTPDRVRRCVRGLNAVGSPESWQERRGRPLNLALACAAS